MSNRIRLNRKDMIKVGKGAVIVVVSALLTYTADTIPNIELGVWSPMVMGAFAILTNLVRKWIFRQKE